MEYFFTFFNYNVTLFKVRNCCHDLLISAVAAGLLQLDGQVRQFLGVGRIMADHILHQCQQLLHGSMLTAPLAAAAAAATIMGVVMIMSVLMEVIVVMGMGMIMAVAMGMLVGMSLAVMGVLVGMGVGMGVGMLMGMSAGHIVGKMHNNILLNLVCPLGGCGFCKNRV